MFLRHLATITAITPTAAVAASAVVYPTAIGVIDWYLRASIAAPAAPRIIKAFLNKKEST